MIEISLQSLSQLFSGKITGDSSRVINEIITDSRSVVSSVKSIFFALTGDRNNGHSYITDLYNRGIFNFVVSDYKNEYDNLNDANFIVVNDTLEALHKLGKYHRDNFDFQIVTVIGSNGKTIVKEWLYHLLHDEISIVRSPKSYNSQLGVPISLCLLENKYKLGIIEAGISKPGEMHKLEDIIKPNVVIFTSFGEAHQENFKDKTEKASEKLMMFNNADTLIYSVDYEILTNQIINNEDFIDKNIFTWAISSKNADLKVVKINKHTNSTEIIADFKGAEIKYKIPFIDEASVKNSLSCLAYLITQNLLSENILKKFNTLSPVEMRIQQKQGINDCILINDSYNSDIVSLKIALDLQKNLSGNLKKTVILSDIMQSGMTDNELYKSVAEMFRSNQIDRFIGIGEHIFSQRNLFNKAYDAEFFRSTEKFLKSDIKKKFEKEVILLKGSRNFKFEMISEALELKKHRTVLEINLEAITHNLNYYKSLVSPEIKTMVMVKAFSYGSGTYEIAGLLQHHHVDYLGVAFADEGVELRKSGITTPIMVMNPDSDSLSDIIDFKLEPEIYNFKIFDALIQKLDNHSGSPIPVHIKLDTGMKRLGFCDFDVEELICRLTKYEQIFVKSIFSHLVAADEPEHDGFTKEQINKFRNISDKIIENLKYPVLRHISNTSGIERFPEAVFDMVRIGIGLYGFSKNNNGKLMNVSTLKTRITQIKNVYKDETVGYGRKWKAKCNSKIAIIPIGYADGLSRQLSSGVGEVLINGQKVPIAGNVCMDLCMIDITGIDANEGDEVIIFGDEYPASEIAKKLNTIPYEIITGISERVKRVYLG